MGDRLLKIQEDFETMQRLMNELEYENKQYEQEIQKEMQLISELDCKTEAAKQEVKLNKEAAKQQDEESKLLNKQCIQNMHSYNSLQEACDILNEQEKSLSRHLRELKNSDETASEKRKATVDHYESIYNGYKEKYEKYPLNVQRKQKEGELANLEENYNEAKLQAEETAKKVMWFETTASQKAATSVNEFPVFKNQKEFIIKLAEMKVTFADLERKKICCEELKKTTVEKVKAKRHLEEEEEKKRDELMRIAEERASDERSIAEKRIKAEVRRHEDRRLHSEELRSNLEQRQQEETRLKGQKQNITCQVPFQRFETACTSQRAALQATTAFQQRLPPKIFLPARQMSFQQKQNNDLGVFLAPLPPKDRHSVTATGKRVQSGENSATIGTLVQRSESLTTTKAGPVTGQKPYPTYPVVTAVSVPPRQPQILETIVTTPMQPNQPSCAESSTGITVLPKQVPCLEACGAIASCLKNLSIVGHTDQNFFMETEDEEALPFGFNVSSFPHAGSRSVTLSGFDQNNETGATEDQVNLMLSTSTPVGAQEANQERQNESYLDTAGTEIPMSTDQEDQLPFLEASASATGFICPEISENVSHAESSCQSSQMSSTIVSCYNSVMLDDPISLGSVQDAPCVSTLSLTTSACLPLAVFSSSDLSSRLNSEAVAHMDCRTVTVTSSTTCPATIAPADVQLYCPTTAENAMAVQVSDATSVVSSVALNCPTASMSMLCDETSVEPSGYAICATQTPVISIAQSAEAEKFIASSSPIIEFNFEEEMAKLKSLSESPALNLYSGRRMFAHSGQSEVVDIAAPVRETGGTTSFMSNIGQFENAQQPKESDKAANSEFGFGNLFSFDNRSDSNEMFSFFGSRGNETEKSRKDRDDVFKLFGGNDTEDTLSSKKDTGGERSGDIFNMFASGGGNTANSSKNKSDDGDGGFFNFGAKPANDGPVKNQFKFF